MQAISEIGKSNGRWLIAWNKMRGEESCGGKQARLLIPIFEILIWFAPVFGAYELLEAEKLVWCWWW